MNIPDIQMENIKPLEGIPMTAAETAALHILVTDMIYATPRTAQPVITRGDRTLRYSPDAPNVVTLAWGSNPNALHMLFLYAPDWTPWQNGKWTPPPDVGIFAEHSSAPAFFKKDTH